MATSKNLDGPLPTDSDLNVLCFGDSNTWGFKPGTLGERIPRESRWTTLLENQLREGDSRFNVVVDALNARTSVFDDPVGPAFSTYSCNGRPFLSNALHAHKPLAAVVLALGTNDIKDYLGTTPKAVANGIMVLVNDIRRALGCGLASQGTTGAPKIVVVTCPELFETSTALDWGFADCASKSARVNSLISEACKVEGVPVVTGMPRADSLDGIHYSIETQAAVADKIASSVLSTL